MPCSLAEVFITEDLIDYIYKEKELSLTKLVQHLGKDPFERLCSKVNQYVLFRGFTDPKKSIICKTTDRSSFVKIIGTKNLDLVGIQPRDSKQACLIDSLADPNILLTCGIGPAGTGKTTMAMSYALAECFQKDKKLFMSKSTALVGKARTFGAVPGDINEKYAPHIESYKIILRKLLGDKSDAYVKLLQDKEQIKYIPIEYARGATFEHCTFIIDEVQNLDWHELKTICSRMGEGANLVLLGDLEQIDLEVSHEESGIYKLITSESYAKSSITSLITLDQQYRGPIPTLMSDIDKELRKTKV